MMPRPPLRALVAGLVTRGASLWRALSDYVAWCVFVAHVDIPELWSAFLALAWGTWLALPFFDVFTGAYYGGMAYLASESVWGVFAAAAATVQIYGRLRGRPRYIQLGARAIAALWWFAAGALMMQNWRFATTIMYPALGMLSLFVSWRAAVPPPGDFREAGYGWST